LDEDAAPWRCDALRALARRLHATSEQLASLRPLAGATDERLGDTEQRDRDGALAFLWLRGDAVALARVEPHERARSGLLAPEHALARAPRRLLHGALAEDRRGGAGG